MSAGYWSMGRHWHQPRIPYVETRAMFLSRGIGPAVSALEAFLPSASQIARLQNRAVDYGRRALRGAAT
eukprot:8723892-Pyramimonas_sp.AAC.1